MSLRRLLLLVTALFAAAFVVTLAVGVVRARRCEGTCPHCGGKHP